MNVTNSSFIDTPRSPVILRNSRCKPSGTRTVTTTLFPRQRGSLSCIQHTILHARTARKPRSQHINTQVVTATQGCGKPLWSGRGGTQERLHAAPARERDAPPLRGERRATKPYGCCSAMLSNWLSDSDSSPSGLVGSSTCVDTCVNGSTASRSFRAWLARDCAGIDVSIAPSSAAIASRSLSVQTSAFSTCLGLPGRVRPSSARKVARLRRFRADCWLPSRANSVTDRVMPLCALQ